MPAPEKSPAVGTSLVESPGKKFPLTLVLVGVSSLLFVAILTLLVLDISGVRTALMESFKLSTKLSTPEKGPTVTQEVPTPTPEGGGYTNPFSEEGGGSEAVPGYKNPFEEDEEEYVNPFEGMEEEYVNPFENL